MVRVFIGTSPGEDDKDAEKVLEYSLKKNCSEPIEVVFMRNNKDPNNFFGNFNDDPWWTPFSYLRWAIPEYCNFKGRAIYMDVDQVNFRDISQLFHMDLKGRSVAIREEDFRTCVMVMDCEKLKGKLPAVQDLKINPPERFQDLVDTILKDNTTYDRRWNCLDGEAERSCNIWHLHFTEMTTQPWSPAWVEEAYKKKGTRFEKCRHPRGDLVYIWKYLLQEANNV
jgi:hypothetical protein